MNKQLITRPAKQAGFTLIELIIVIVIIAILAAVAIPKYSDLTAEAKAAALSGVAGNYASAYAVNKAMCAAYPADTNKCITIAAADACKDASLALLLPGLSGYTAAGDTAACVITQTGGSSVTLKLAS